MTRSLQCERYLLTPNVDFVPDLGILSHKDNEKSRGCAIFFHKCWDRIRPGLLGLRANMLDGTGERNLYSTKHFEIVSRKGNNWRGARLVWQHSRAIALIKPNVKPVVRDVSIQQLN
jgi:hypothetical protein